MLRRGCSAIGDRRVLRLDAMTSNACPPPHGSPQAPEPGSSVLSRLSTVPCGRVGAEGTPSILASMRLCAPHTRLPQRGLRRRYAYEREAVLLQCWSQSRFGICAMRNHSSAAPCFQHVQLTPSTSQHAKIKGNRHRNYVWSRRWLQAS
jgi:hypothetical protein